MLPFKTVLVTSAEYVSNVNEPCIVVLSLIACALSWVVCLLKGC